MLNNYYTVNPVAVFLTF